MKGYISILGARENNLKNIDVKIPWQKITVLTGLSGSGKSSLAMDTLYAEGLRRYVECLSTYARQFFEKVDRPDMDDIVGLPPVVAIESTNQVKSARSTVGTTTEVYDYLRLLFAKIGRVYCPACGSEVKPSSPDVVVNRLLREHEGERGIVTVPIDVKRVTRDTLLSGGFTRILRSGEVLEVEETELAEGDEVIIDRLVIERGGRGRLAEAIETAFSDSRHVHIHIPGLPKLVFSKEFECPNCPEIEFIEPTPLLFSFNNPQGACRHCNGFGNILRIDPELVVPNPEKSLREGAIEPLTKPSLKYEMKRMLNFAVQNGINIDLPYKKLTDEQKRLIFEGKGYFPGVLGIFEYLEEKKYKVQVRVFLSRYRSPFTCSYCGGSRLRTEALWVKVGGKNISELSDMPVSSLSEFFESLSLTRYEEDIAREILKQIRSRIGFLLKVGLEYLTLSRLTRTLSGGEAQRVNLACQLGSSLTETLYIMDEPSVGLHPRDVDRLISIIKELRDRGNTVVMVEHDFDMIRSSDHIVELGPLAGENGGRVVFQGSLSEFLRWDGDSMTKLYMSGVGKIEMPRKRRPLGGAFLTVKGAQENNLKGIDVRIPLGTMTCITGVSGSGKSSLVHDVIYGALARHFHGEVERVGRYDEILGIENLSDVVMLDQSPIGRSSRSNPVTYIKAYDEIRKVMVCTPEARSKGLTPASFSFNVPGGRCEACQGEGVQRIEMQFLADVVVTCEECGGRRFKKEILSVKYKGKNIDEILSLTASEAMLFFQDIPAIARKLGILGEVGLDYLRLGQPAPSLSGGEAQRIKIARELGRKEGKGILYIMDEPTVGLHADDVRKLLNVINRLVDAGNTVVVIEHNLEVIKSADYVIDLGPDGGERGGYVVGTGRPEDIAQIASSYTGKYLQRVLYKIGWELNPQARS